MPSFYASYTPTYALNGYAGDSSGSGSATPSGFYATYVPVGLERGGGGSPPPPYDPATDPNATAVWESDANVSATAGLVASWTDRTSNALVATGASGHQPALIANQLNGLPTIRFTATTPDGLGLPANTALIPDAGSPWTVSFVLKHTGFANSTFQALLSSHLTAANETFFIEMTNDTAHYGPGVFFGSNTVYTAGGGAVFSAAVTFQTSSYAVWTVTYNGSGGATPSNFTFTDGGAPLSVNALTGVVGAAPSYVPTIGAENNATYPDPGDYFMAAIYVFKAALTGTELSNFNSYITSKWGL